MWNYRKECKAALEMLQLCHRPWQSPKAKFPWYGCQQTQSSSNRVAWDGCQQTQSSSNRVAWDGCQQTQSSTNRVAWDGCQQTQSSSNRVAWEVETVSTKRAEWNFVCGYCAESERYPDFIVRFHNATCGLADSVNRHSYLYWPPELTQFMYPECQYGAVCLQSTGKAISPCSKCPGCCLLISPAGQHRAFRL